MSGVKGKTSERQVVREEKEGVGYAGNGRVCVGGGGYLTAQRDGCQHRCCKITDFLLIIPSLLRFNYSLSELSVRLRL